MVFKTTLSPKQSFTFRGSTYKALGGIFATEDTAIIEFLNNNKYWIADKPIKVKEEKKIIKKKEK